MGKPVVKNFVRMNQRVSLDCCPYFFAAIEPSVCLTFSRFCSNSCIALAAVSLVAKTCTESY